MLFLVLFDYYTTSNFQHLWFCILCLAQRFWWFPWTVHHGRCSSNLCYFWKLPEFWPAILLPSSDRDWISQSVFWFRFQRMFYVYRRYHLMPWTSPSKCYQDVFQEFMCSLVVTNLLLSSIMIIFSNFKSIEFENANSLCLWPAITPSINLAS